MQYAASIGENWFTALWNHSFGAREIESTLKRSTAAGRIRRVPPESLILHREVGAVRWRRVEVVARPGEGEANEEDLVVGELYAAAPEPLREG